MRWRLTALCDLSGLRCAGVVLAAEKRITRARRAVEKAAHLLDGDPDLDD